MAFFIKIGFLDAAVVTARIKEGSVELHSMHCSAQVQKPCAKCKRDFTFMSKDQSGETICKPCKSKRVLFIQMFGKWPIAPFLELSDEQQIAVWQSGNTKKMLQAKLMEEVTNQRVEAPVKRARTCQ